MGMLDIKEQHRLLTIRINQLNHYYYNLSSPLVSDDVYDALWSMLKSIEKQYPDVTFTDSPTKNIGAPPESDLRLIKHQHKMLSLDNVFTYDELQSWVGGVTKQIGPTQFTAELKADGVSLSLVYKDGLLFQAITRGDGEFGEDVTLNAYHIDGIPNILKEKTPGFVIVRGEVVVHKVDFNAINEKMLSDGHKAFSNERNYASGSLRQKNPQITANRKLRFYAYSLTSGIGYASINEARQILKSIGFNVIRQVYSTKVEHIDDVPDIDFMVIRETTPYVIDGVVVKVDVIEKHNQLVGEQNRAPKWAIAFKPPAEVMVSRLLKVDYTVGRTGNLTPVARIEPVTCGGVVISNVLLHNLDEISRLNLKIGSNVLVERRGDVIPKIMGTLPSVDTTDIPTVVKCPSCGTLAKKRTIGIYSGKGSIIHCDNTANCEEQLVRQMEYFVSIDGLNIQGLGTETIRLLVNKGKLKKFTDLFKLTTEDFTELDGFSKKVAKKLVRRIADKSKINNVKFLAALGIPGVGLRTANIIVDAFGNVHQMYTCIQYTGSSILSLLDGIGPLTIQDISNWFNHHRGTFLELLAGPFVHLKEETKINDIYRGTIRDIDIDKLAAKAYWSPEAVSKLKNDLKDIGLHEACGRVATKKPLDGMTVVITGVYETLVRSQLKHLLEENGAKVSDTVTAKTTSLFMGARPGSKVGKATKLNVPIMNEKETVHWLKSKGIYNV